MLMELPLEIQVKLLKLCPSSNLKFVHSHFYLLYNDLFFEKLINVFGIDVIQILKRVYPWLRTYIKSLDVFRKESRIFIASRKSLPEVPENTQNIEEILNSQFIEDSWRYIFSLFKNKRLFAEYSDYKIDEPTNYIYNHFVEVNRSYLLSYQTTVWLAAGKYNLNIGLVVKHGSGLGTTKFEIEYITHSGDTIIKTFYPPSNINEILPKNDFCFMKVAEFELPKLKHSGAEQGPNHHHQLYKVHVTMEEIGLYLKSGFSIYFIDFSQPSLLLNDYDLLYYSCKEADYRYYINLQLKNFYKALNCVQSGSSGNSNPLIEYGRGNPLTAVSEDESDSGIEDIVIVEEGVDKIMAYANFFFNSISNQRYFKFNTVYQRRQFVNRFGDFEKCGIDSHCAYDKHRLKWKIPIIGEL